MSQDKGGLGFYKQSKTTPVSLTKPIAFLKAKEHETPIIYEADALSNASTRQISEEYFDNDKHPGQSCQMCNSQGPLLIKFPIINVRGPKLSIL